MTAQVMPLNMADMSDEKLADFFFAKAFTDDEPKGELPTIPKERWRLTLTELEFIRAATSPAERQRKGGRTMVDRWAGICDVGCMAELVRREPALLQSVGPLLIRATVAMRGCALSTKAPCSLYSGCRRPSRENNGNLKRGGTSAPYHAGWLLRRCTVSLPHLPKYCAESRRIAPEPSHPRPSGPATAPLCRRC